MMTLNTEVSGELEAALKAQAHEQGLTADKVARRILAQALTPGLERTEAAGVPTGEENARAFIAWAKSHRGPPPLSGEALSLASMYPDRW